MEQLAVVQDRGHEDGRPDLVHLHPSQAEGRPPRRAVRAGDVQAAVQGHPQPLLVSPSSPFGISSWKSVGSAREPA
jgi:hypothetical protein